jgi:acetyl-CoA acyltransferase
MRAVIVGGVRTPFVSAAGALDHVHAPELGRLVTRELIERYDLDPAEVDELICGNVASPVDAANVARVIALRAGIPRDKVAHSVHRNCASGMESLTQAVDRVNLGHADTVIAVGVDSMSNVPLFYPKRFGTKLLGLSKAKTSWQKLKGMLGFRLSDFAPRIGIKLGLTDPVTGLLMGDTADKLARIYDIDRDEQDAFALRSHERAVAAWKDGRLDDETFTLYPDRQDPVQQDVGPRDGQTLEKLGKLRPYFDKRWGTVTVGNSCGITDGAVALLVMSEEKARALGHEPLGRLRSYAYAGCDPSTMGLGPVYSSAKALQLAGTNMDAIDLVEINEAFAAQVLACTRGFENPPEDCTTDAGRATLGPIDPDKLNVNGGAIAIGHPVGATGGRLVLTLLHELKRRNQTTGLATLCIGGGQGGACVVERLAA